MKIKNILSILSISLLAPISLLASLDMAAQKTITIENPYENLGIELSAYVRVFERNRKYRDFSDFYVGDQQVSYRGYPTSFKIKIIANGVEGLNQKKLAEKEYRCWGIEILGSSVQSFEDEFSIGDKSVKIAYSIKKDGQRAVTGLDFKMRDQYLYFIESAAIKITHFSIDDIEMPKNEL